jgi:putative ABC transport system permease protein
VGATTVLPPYQGVMIGVAVRPAGTPVSDRIFATWDRATRGYLAAMGTPVLEGRPFPPEAAGGSPFDHVVLNRSLAQRLLGDGPGAGRTILVQDNDEKWHESRVDAVVADVRLRGALRGASSFVVTDLAASPTSYPTFAVRSPRDPAQLAQRIRDVVKSVDPSVAPYDMKTTGEAAAQEIAARRAVALLSSLFSLAALAVCALGLHGLVAERVSRRRRELGVRLALGARIPSLVRRTTLAPLHLVAVGLLLGVPAAWALSELSKSLLFEVGPHDPLVMIGVGIVLVALAVAAAWIPARRITRVDPAEALRSE